MNARETDTVFLNRYGPGPALRALRTDKTTRYELAPPADIMSEFKHAQELYFGGDMEASIAVTGQVMGRIDSIRPVAEILHDMMTQFQDVVADLARRSALEK